MDRDKEVRPPKTAAEIRLECVENYGFERGGVWAGYCTFETDDNWISIPDAVPQPIELLTRIAEEYCHGGWEAVCGCIQSEVSAAENVGWIKNDAEKKAFCIGFAYAMRSITGTC